jgi:two-component system, NarL family, sensor histidine kinase UhpB
VIQPSVDAIAIPEIKFAALAQTPGEVGTRIPASEPRHRQQLRWRIRALFALRVVLALLLVTLAGEMWNWPLDSVPGHIETCFSQHEQAEPEEMIAACVGGSVARAVRAAWLMRATVLSLVAAIVATVVIAMLVRASDRNLLRDELHFEQQLIDALPLPLWVRSAEGVLLHVNRAFEVRHGVSRRDLLGQSIAAVLGPDAGPVVARMQERALKTNEPVDQEFEVTTPRGRRNVLTRLRALRRVDGSLIGLLGVQNDITALRRKESELIESNGRLKQLSMQLLQAQEDERRRIARDLHDQVGQVLTVLKLQLRGLAQRSSLPGAALAASIDMAEEALGHTRNLSTSLHPHLLDDLGLEHALNWLVDRFIRRSVPTVDIVCRLNPPRAEPSVELVAFRVVQEALTNVVRHAQASRVGIILEAERGQLSIEVLDDGVGFDGVGQVDLLRTTSLGLTSMYERVAECGGQMHIDSSRGGGTSLRVRLPWKASEA